MSESLDKIVGRRIWLDYYDQNEKFEKAFLPQSCEVVRRFVDEFGLEDWYLVRLTAPLCYNDKPYGHLMIRSRWADCALGGKEPTSVFIVLVPDPDVISERFHLDRSLFIAWGMASRDNEAARSETTKRKRADAVMDSIRKILFNDWDPIGINDSAPEDEYDAYIGVIYRSLSSGATEADIAEDLRKLELEQIGSATSPAHRYSVANKLKQINVSIQ